MKTFVTIVISLFVISEHSFAVDKFAVASGNWGLTSTWSLTRGGAPGAAVPAATDSVIIPSPFEVIVEGSGKTCLAINVESGAYLAGDIANPTSSQRYIRVSGFTVLNDGVIGYTSAAPTVNTNICFESFVALKTVTFIGSGITKISRIRNGNNISNTTVVIDQDMTFTYTGSSGGGGVCWYGNQGTGTGNTLKINSGRTVTVVEQGYIATTSSVDTDGPTTTIQVDGSLLMQGANCTMSLRPTSGAVVSLIVNGTVEVGRTLKPTGNTGVTSTITINTGGELKVGTAGPGVIYFNIPSQTVTGLGTFTFSGAGGAKMQIGSAFGLDPTNGPIRTTTRNFPASAGNFEYIGTAAQVTGSELPATVNNLTINNATGVTLTNSLTVDGTLNMTSGSLSLNSNTLAYGGTGTLTYNGTTAQASSDNEFPASNGPANLTLNNTSGVTISAAKVISGMLNLGGNNSYTNLSNISGYSGVTYSASVAQSTGAEFGLSITDLTINNTNGVTLGGSKLVNGILTFTNGKLFLGANNLVLGTSASVGGTPSASSMVVTDGSGEMRKEYSAVGLFTFPVGDNTGTAEYSPATVTINSADAFTSAYVSVKLVDAVHPNNTSGTDFLSRYWTLGASGITNPNYTATFKYVDADINGTETSIYCGKYDAGWTLYSLTDDVTNTLTASGVSSFSDFSGGENSAMPVELTSFVAKGLQRGAELKWTTATEVSNHGFEIERNSGSGWSKAGFVDGAGNSNVSKSYSFVDASLSAGKYEYRLKQIDNNGSFKYVGSVESIEVGVAPKVLTLADNYPNPFNPTTNIEFTVPNDGFASLIVFNAIGQEVATIFSGMTQAGKINTAQFNATQLPSGMYFSKLQFGNNSIVKRMLLVK